MGATFGLMNVKAPSSPEMLLEQVEQLHKQGRISEITALLAVTAVKVRSGGMLAVSLFGITSLGNLNDRAPVKLTAGDPSAGPWRGGQQVLSPRRRVSRAQSLLPTASAAQEEREQRAAALPADIDPLTDDRALNLGMKGSEGSDDDDEIDAAKKEKKEDEESEEGDTRQSVPMAVVKLAEKLCSCTHMSCKMAFLLLADAASSPLAENFSLQQRLQNQEAMAEVTSSTLCAAFNLRKRMVARPKQERGERAEEGLRRLAGVGAAMESSQVISFERMREHESHVLAQIGRAYCRSSTFRAHFVERSGADFLMVLARDRKRKHRHKVTLDTALLIPVLAAFRTVIEFEVSGGRRGDAGLSQRLIESGLPRLLVDTINLPNVDQTAIVEVAATIPWVVRVCGVQPFMACATFLLDMLDRGSVITTLKDGSEPDPLNPSLVVVAMKAICFLVRMDDRVLLRSMAGDLLTSVCRRVLICNGEYDSSIFYVVLTLERVVNQLATVDINEANVGNVEAAKRHADSVRLCMDALASALRRVVISVLQPWDPLADCLGKLCWLLCILTKKPKHKIIMLTHGCTHILCKEVLKKPELPDWILVPCVECVGSLIGHEAQAVLHAKQLPKEQYIPGYRIADVVAPLCRLLEATHRGHCWEHTRTIEACLGTLLRLVTDEHSQHDENAAKAFNMLPLSDLWKWENLRMWIKKERERKVTRLRLGREDYSTDGIEEEADALKEEEVREYRRLRITRAERVLQKWDELVLDLPACLNITWEANWLDEQCNLDESLTNVGHLAYMFRVGLEAHKEIAEYCAKYNSTAAKLQKWWKQRVVHKKLLQAAVEKYENQQAAVLIQTNWRGRCARKKHQRDLEHEANKRRCACYIQRKWRDYSLSRQKEAKCMFDYVYEKLRMPPLAIDDIEKPDIHASGDGKKKGHGIVDLDFDTFYEEVMNDDLDKRNNSLILFYSPFDANCRRVMQPYENLAYHFKEDPQVMIARLNGEDSPTICRKFGIDGLPGLVWIDAENDTHLYDAEWPRKPMTIRQMIENFVAIEIQRSWRGRRVRRGYMKLMERLRAQDRMVLQKNMRVACEAGDLDKLGSVLEEGQPNDLVDTDELPLNIAIRKSNKETFAALIRAGADINCEDTKGHTPVFYAAAAGLHEVMRLLIKRGADLHHRAADGKSVLHVACEAGEEGCAALLMNSGLEKECFIRDRTKHTPLDYALVSGLESISMRLMLKGVTVNRRMEERMLFHSLIKDMHNISKLIIQQGLVDLAQHDQSEQKWTPLHYAAAMGNYTVIMALVDKGIDPMPRSEQKQTPLHLAAKNGHEMPCDMLMSCMQVACHVTSEDLLESYYDHEGLLRGPHVDVDGNTVLHYCCNQPSLAGVAEKLLGQLETTAKLPGRNHSGNTPLHFAASKGMYFVSSILAERLVSQGQVDELNEAGNTPLHLAVMCGHRDIMCMLLDMDSQSMDITDPDGNTLLHFACATRSVDVQQACVMVDALLNEYEHPPNVMNDKGLTPLHIAASEGHTDLVQRLATCDLIDTAEERQVFIDAPDNEGNTALHYACHRSKFETDKASPNYPNNAPMIRFLVLEGADPDAENINGYKPRDLVENDAMIKQASKARERKREKEQVESMMK